MYQTKYHTKDLSKLSFLVTGGAGFIGSNIVEYLLKYGAKKVRILDDLSNGYYANISEFENNPAFEFIKGDICNLDTCIDAMKDIDYVSHQAALGSVPRSIDNPIRTDQVNSGGFLNMLSALKDSKTVKRMVYAASSSTYGDSKTLPKVEHNIGKPLSPYAITKYVNELYADVFGNLYQTDTIGFRYFNIFGPKQSPNGAYAAVIPLFMQAIVEGESPTINGDGEQTRDFTFVENAVQANIKGMFADKKAGNEVYNIACGDRVSLNTLWDVLQEVSSKKIKAIYGPDRLGDVKDSLANIDKAANFIKYNPLFDINKGLKITYKWFTKTK